MKTLTITETTVKSILTRSSGYLDRVASHSLQPYSGCGYGNSLCGVGCYARHNGFVTKGRVWGSFLDAKTNAAEAYASEYRREQRWARKRAMGRFVIFCASVTDPFVPQERRYRITRKLLDAMIDQPPDGLILQTHTHRVADELSRLVELSRCCELRVQISIESDRERLPGLSPSASPVAKRLTACEQLRDAGVRTIVAVAPLLPIADPRRFFQRISAAADGVILDHFIGGDGSRNGSRTLRTPLPTAIAAIDPAAVTLDYLDEMISVARDIMPGRVGIGPSGFAGVFE